MTKNKTGKKQAAQVVSVLGYEDSDDRGSLTRRLVRDVIDVEKLGDEVRAFMGAMEKIIGNLSEQVGNYHMETVALTAEVSAKGHISLLGSGGDVGGKGGMTFTFKRSAPAGTNS